MSRPQTSFTRRAFALTTLAASLAISTRLPATTPTDQSTIFNPKAFQTLTTTIRTGAGDVTVSYRFTKPFPTSPARSIWPIKA